MATETKTEARERPNREMCGVLGCPHPADCKHIDREPVVPASALSALRAEHRETIEALGLMKEVAAQAQRERDEARQKWGELIPKLRAAEALADEVAVLVRRHVVDARSPAGDALLDYRDPPPTERSDRMAKMERELTGLRSQLDEVTKGREEARKNTQRFSRFYALLDETFPAVDDGRRSDDELIAEFGRALVAKETAQ